MFLRVRRHHVGQSMQIQTFFTQGFAVVTHVNHRGFKILCIVLEQGDDFR